jgi:RNA polymerase sigma-70 factor (ECF subfamily)
MAEISETSRENARVLPAGKAMSAPATMDWFLREVLPLEAMLLQFLRHNWRDSADIEDLLHDVYVRVYEAALKQVPDRAKPFVFTTARNLLISRVRTRHVVPIEAVADLDALGVAIDTPGPDRSAIARDELRRLRDAIDRLPPHCRAVVIMRRIDDLSRGEIATRLSLTEGTVSVYLTEGMYALADLLNGELPDPRRHP